jgi:K+-sensing histidine kinase KdpD
MANRDSQRKRLVELVVHDLRNPLSALLGNIEHLREELGEGASPAAREGLDDCAALTTRALSLVACILDVEELEKGDLQVERTPVDLAELVAAALARNAPAIRVRALSVDLRIPEGMQASLDGGLFERVLEHLLDNGVRYARRGGRVEVAVTRDASTLEIAIGNDGPPVPASEREAIFGRHYRADERRAKVHRGLGLYFCRLAIEAHGGTIAVEERPPLGAVFVARLPVP